MFRELVTRGVNQLRGMRKRHYGVIWAGTENLGDDVQTLAAIDMLRRYGITEYSLIERERIRDYDGPPVIVVMNGWFAHQTHRFGPNPNILPMFIGFHCAPYAEAKVIAAHKDYFRRFQPIGARDLHTHKLMEKHGIESYVSGCLTQTFDAFPDKGDAVFLSNTPHDSEPTQYEGEKTLLGHIALEELGVDPERVEYVDHAPGVEELPPEERLELARQLLNKYRRARLLITSRLHAALPARAFHTPVAFVHRDYHRDARFSGFQRILNGAAKGPIGRRHAELDVEVANHCRASVLAHFDRAWGEVHRHAAAARKNPSAQKPV